MDTSEDSTRTLDKSLRRSQRKHAELLAKVERTSARLERRTAKLHTLESRIADLERRLSEPRRKHADQQQEDAGLLRARLVFNPSSGRGGEDGGELLAELIGALRAHGIEPVVEVKTSGKAARNIARSAVDEGDELIIVAAGDGTIGEVAAELIGTSTTIGIVPIGTMNNVARSLGVPLTIDDACALIGMGTTRHIDVGRVISANGPTPSEVFLECAGVGLSSVLAAAGQSVEKHRWSHLPHLLKRFSEERPNPMQVQIDDVTLEVHTHMVTVSNSPLVGNNLLVAPDGLMDDGLLDVQVYDGLGEAELARHFASTSSGKPLDLPIYRARRVCIRSETPIAVNADVSIGRPRRVIEIEAIPRAVSMIVGNGMALRVPVEAVPKISAFGPAPPAHPNGTDEAVVKDANAGR